MGVTPWTKLPYPEATEPVKNGAANIKALAQATEAAYPAFGVAAGSSVYGRGSQQGDRGTDVTWRGTQTTNQFGQVSIPTVAGTAGWAYADARAWSSVQNGGLIYLVLDSANSSVNAAAFYVYQQANNTIMANYAATFMAVIHGWMPISVVPPVVP